MEHGRPWRTDGRIVNPEPGAHPSRPFSYLHRCCCCLSTPGLFPTSPPCSPSFSGLIPPDRICTSPPCCPPVLLPPPPRAVDPMERELGNQPPCTLLVQQATFSLTFPSGSNHNPMIPMMMPYFSLSQKRRLVPGASRPCGWEWVISEGALESLERGVWFRRAGTMHRCEWPPTRRIESRTRTDPTKQCQTAPQLGSSQQYAIGLPTEEEYQAAGRGEGVRKSGFFSSPHPVNTTPLIPLPSTRHAKVGLNNV